MSPIEQAIVEITKHHGSMYLKELRTKVNEYFNLDIEPDFKQLPLDTVKTIAMCLCEAKTLEVKQIGNGYLFKYRGPHDQTHMPLV